MMNSQTHRHPGRLGTGAPGLDEILDGGLPAGRMYLLEGAPGTGKTTLALQFLIEGRRRGETVVYLTLSETEDELRAVADSHGMSLEGIQICDLQAAQRGPEQEAAYTFFHPSEIELNATMEAITRVVEEVRPARIALDSLSEMRLLAGDSLRYRRQMLALKQFISQNGGTLLALDTGTSGESFHLATIAHGVLELDQHEFVYGRTRRRVRVRKLRGVRHQDGFHDYEIRTGGVRVFPRLQIPEGRGDAPHEILSSGIAELDAMLHGGIPRGTSCLMLGPSGVGKSSMAMQLVREAIKRGERASVYLFEESLSTWLERSDSLGMDLRERLSRGELILRGINPAEHAPDEFAQMIRRDVEEGDVHVVVIDSLSGYKAAMPGESFIDLHFHDLLAYLGQKRVTTLVVVAQQGLLAESLESSADLSYIADTVVLLRYFEAFGEVRTVMAVVKKRTGHHDRAVREFRLGPPEGLRLGAPVTAFSGILSGRPRYLGGAPELLHEK